MDAEQPVKKAPRLAKVVSMGNVKNIISEDVLATLNDFTILMDNEVKMDCSRLLLASMLLSNWVPLHREPWTIKEVVSNICGDHRKRCLDKCKNGDPKLNGFMGEPVTVFISKKEFLDQHVSCKCTMNYDRINVVDSELVDQ